MTRVSHVDRPMTGPFWEIRPGEVFWSDPGGAAYRKVGDRGAVRGTLIHRTFTPDRVDEIDMTPHILDDYEYLAGRSPQFGLTSLRRLQRSRPFLVGTPHQLDHYAESSAHREIAAYGTLFTKRGDTTAVAIATNHHLYNLDQLLMVHGLRRIVHNLCDACHGTGFNVRITQRDNLPHCVPCHCVPGRGPGQWDYLLGESGMIFDTFVHYGEEIFTLPCWSHFARNVRVPLPATSEAQAAATVSRPLLFMGSTTGRTASRLPPSTQELFLRATVPVNMPPSQIDELLMAMCHAQGNQITLERIEQLPLREPPTVTNTEHERTRVVQLDADDQTSH